MPNQISIKLQILAAFAKMEEIRVLLHKLMNKYDDINTEFANYLKEATESCDLSLYQEMTERHNTQTAALDSKIFLKKLEHNAMVEELKIKYNFTEVACLTL